MLTRTSNSPRATNNTPEGGQEDAANTKKKPLGKRVSESRLEVPDAVKEMIPSSQPDPGTEGPARDSSASPTSAAGGGSEEASAASHATSALNPSKKELESLKIYEDDEAEGLKHTRDAAIRFIAGCHDVPGMEGDVAEKQRMLAAIKHELERQATRWAGVDKF